MNQTQAKHTPGPWIARHPFLDKNGLTVFGRGEMPICYLAGPTAEADAHLIAAAPGLLEALKRVAMSPELNCDDAHGRGCDCVGDAVRAAIAKAEGRET